MKHDFGLLPWIPGDERYDAYLPERIDISIDDEDIEPLMEELDKIPSYYHTRLVPGMGLAYCGITLIPPDSAARFAAIFHSGNGDGRYSQAAALFERAAQEGKFIIHFGL